METKDKQTEFFSVAVVSRGDLEHKGFNAKDLSDETMQVIASKAADYMLDGCDFWTAIVESAVWHGITRKEE